MGKFGPIALYILLGVVLIARVFWFGDFFRRCWIKSAGQSGRPCVAWTLARRTAAQMERGTYDRHNRLLEAEARRLEIMLVGGSIALAAWSQLFVSSDQPPADRLSALTLGLLFAGAACLIVGPLLWRAEGLYITMMGRDAALHIGFTLIAFSLSSVTFDLHWTVAEVIGIVIAILIGLREVVDVITWISKMHPQLAWS